MTRYSSSRTTAPQGSSCGQATERRTARSSFVTSIPASRRLNPSSPSQSLMEAIGRLCLRRLTLWAVTNSGAATARPRAPSESRTSHPVRCHHPSQLYGCWSTHFLSANRRSDRPGTLRNTSVSPCSCPTRQCRRCRTDSAASAEDAVCRRTTGTEEYRRKGGP